MSEVTAEQLRAGRIVIQTPCPECGKYLFGESRYSGQHFPTPGEFWPCPGPGASSIIIADRPLTLAALQAGAEEHREAHSGRHQVVLVPRSE